MPLPMRACLALALAWAGGFGLPGPPGLELPLLAIVMALGWWLGSASQEPPPARAAGALATLALAVLLALLARTLGRVLIATPAALWSVPIAMLVLVLARRRHRRAIELALAPVLVGLALAAALLGAGFEAAGAQASGRVFGSPVLGVHPRQAVAVRIDGFGPHDIIADDYVDPPGGQGYDPRRWAAHLEAELHAIASQHYADGPARARAAYAGATVEVYEALLPEAERDSYASLLGLEVRSGTTGAGSTVEFVCPGQPLDPRSNSHGNTSDRSCPRKYLPDGSTGLGLAARFPAHTQVIGRDRARLARVLGWPSGDAKLDRRALALESAAWLFALVLACWSLAPSRGRSEAARTGAGMLAIASAGLLLLALLAPPSPASVDHGGPTLLAILLLLIPARSDPQRAALPSALLLALLAASPLAGHGDAVELVAITRDALLELGIAWPSAAALAAALAATVLTVGAGISALALISAARPLDDPAGRERRHTSGLSLLLVLACACGLALRKPVDDLPLLQGAAALLTLAHFRLRSRPQQLGLALVCTAAAAAPLLDGDVGNPVALALVGLATLLCLGLGLGLGLGRFGPPRSGPDASSSSN